MKMMKDSGIDAAVVSWWGQPNMPGRSDTQGVSTDNLLPAVLDAAQAEGIKIAFHLEYFITLCTPPCVFCLFFFVPVRVLRVACLRTLNYSVSLAYLLSYTSNFAFGFFFPCEVINQTNFRRFFFFKTIPWPVDPVN